MKNFFYIFITLIVVWVIITVNINRFKFPNKTETQLFIELPKSFLLRFEKCLHTTAATCH
jgi:hypothetical protein